MAISFVSASSYQVLPHNTNTEINKPSGVVEGDLLIFFAMCDNGSSGGITVPSGWSLLTSLSLSAFRANTFTYYKVATASEPSTYTFKAAFNGDVSACLIGGWRGVDTANPINASNIASYSSSSSTINVPSITTTTDDCVLVALSGENQDHSYTSLVAGALTERASSTRTARYFTVADEQLGAAGSVTGRQFTSATNGYFASAAIALAPAASGTEVFTSTTTSAPTFSGSAQVSPVTSFAVTNGLPVFSGSAGSSIEFSFINATYAPSFSGSATGDISSGSITIVDLRDLTTGTLRVSESGITAIVNNVSTGALVALMPSQTSTAGGDMTLTHASITAGVQYRVTIVLSDGSEGTWKYTAA